MLTKHRAIKEEDDMEEDDDDTNLPGGNKGIVIDATSEYYKSIGKGITIFLYPPLSPSNGRSSSDQLVQVTFQPMDLLETATTTLTIASSTKSTRRSWSIRPGLA